MSETSAAEADDGDDDFDAAAFSKTLAAMAARYDMSPAIRAATASMRQTTALTAQFTRDGSALRNVLQRIEDDNRRLTEAFSPGISNVIAQWLERQQELSDAIARWVFPANWEGIARPTKDEIKQFSSVEGIPLMWVPRASTITALRKAGTRDARRTVLADARATIADDCASVLATVAHTSLAEPFGHAGQAALALGDGHHAAAQALAVNLLDTILFDNLDQALHHETTRKGPHAKDTEFNLDAHRWRAGAVLAPVWAAHGRFKREKQETIPDGLARHASAHAVSGKQYTVANAVIAVMLVTSVLKFVDVAGPANSGSGTY
ncbi:hypothetical protein AB0A73_24680 [Glycomyces sp. NPDC047369]